MRLSKSFSLPALLLGLGFSLAAPASAQFVAEPTATVFPLYDSGMVGHTGQGRQVVASFAVEVPGANWMRLYFGPETHLGGDLLQGTGAILVLTSHEDGSVQILNSLHMEQWQNSSAYFNGDAVQVDIVAYANTGQHRVKVAHVDVGWGVNNSICGTDDRVLSSDPRAGRLLPVGCTGVG